MEAISAMWHFGIFIMSWLVVILGVVCAISIWCGKEKGRLGMGFGALGFGIAASLFFSCVQRL
jgi:hypothetical protein